MPPLTAISQVYKMFCKATGIFLVCLYTLSISLDCRASTDRKKEKQQLEENIQSYRININKLQEGILGQQEEIRASIKQESNLLDELQQISSSLLEQLDKMRQLGEQVGSQQGLILIKKDELQVLEDARQGVREHLRKRIKAYYKMGKIGLANVAFSTESMPRMLIFRDSFAKLIDYDKGVIDNYRHSIIEVQSSKKALEREKTVLEDFLRLTKEEEVTLNNLKEEKETLLAQIKTKKGMHKIAVKEMEKAADNLSLSLDKLKKESELFDKGFLMDKGKHPSPVQGKVTVLFGQERKNKLGIIRKNQGITISAPGVNRVKAIFDGKIQYSAYLKGYGKTIIINHGHQYFSVISRLERLMKKKGDRVEQGDLIGLTGDTATLMDDGIYFEIRHGSTPMDPIPWLDKSGLVLP